jgi:hypothetical protein
MTADTLIDRVTSVCAALGFRLAQTPFSFDLQPSGQIDQVFRVEWVSGFVRGGFNYTEERNDFATIWVARTHNGTPHEVYRTLSADVSSLRAAVIRDGLETSGEYLVPDDGFDWDIQRATGSSYAVLRCQIPLNYEATV